MDEVVSDKKSLHIHRSFSKVITTMCGTKTAYFVKAVSRSLPFAFRHQTPDRRPTQFLVATLAFQLAIAIMVGVEGTCGRIFKCFECAGLLGACSFCRCRGHSRGRNSQRARVPRNHKRSRSNRPTRHTSSRHASRRSRHKSGRGHTNYDLGSRVSDEDVDLMEKGRS